MTEQEFSVEAKKRGLREEYILSAIRNFPSMKKELPNLELDIKLIESFLKTQKKMDSSSDDMVSLD